MMGKVIQSKQRMFLVFMIQVAIAFFITNILYVLPSDRMMRELHSLVELLCIVISFTIFLVIWIRYDKHSAKYQLLAFGFITVAVYDTFHAYFFVFIRNNHMNQFDLRIHFWVFARIVETLTLFIFSFRYPLKKINKYFGTLISIGLICLVLYLTFYHKSLLPVLQLKGHMTFLNQAMELSIILILVVTLFLILKNHKNNTEFETYYIALSILIFILSEMCFAFPIIHDPKLLIFGHLLKFLSVYYLFKGIVEVEINKPYLELEKMNKRLSEILEAIPIAINTWDDNMKMGYMNQNFEQLFQYKREDMLGLSRSEFLNIIKKLDYQDEPPITKRLSKNDLNADEMIRTFQILNGDIVKLLIKARKIEDGVLMMYEDVKKLQEIDNLHLQSETIINAITTPICIFDSKSILTNYNKAFIDLLETTDDIIHGLSVHKIINIFVNKAEKIKRIISQLPPTGSYDTTIFTLNTEKKEIRVNVYPIHNILNEEIGSVCVLSDVTAEKENQQKLINQEKLALLGQMGASIVHETRNFLTTIIGSSQVIEKISTDEKTKRLSRQIYADIQEVNRIIGDFLTLSKPKQISLEEIAINDLIDSMKVTLETTSLLKGIEVMFELENIERYISCDVTMIRQVILNLCKNAVEAMAESETPVLTIATHFSEQGNQIELSISDNGIGIPEEHLQKLGKAFFTTKPSGTGLGLNVCFQIIKDHNGTIEVSSKEGEGTTFTIILPIVDDDMDLDELYEFD